MYYLCERGLCCFCIYLERYRGLKHWTIQVYLSTVQHMQIAVQQQDPFGSGVTPMLRLEYELRGIKRKEGSQHGGTRG